MAKFEYLKRPLQGDKGFPVSLGVWDGKDSPPDPPTRPYFDKADDKKYWWEYGKVGQELFEASEHMSTLLREGCRATDGHKPRIKFSNLEPVRHLDTVVYETKSRRVWP